jgi:hypothetical protein
LPEVAQQQSSSGTELPIIVRGEADRLSLIAAAVSALVALALSWALGARAPELIVFGFGAAIVALMFALVVAAMRLRLVGTLTADLESRLPLRLRRAVALIVTMRLGIIATSMYLLIALVISAIFHGPSNTVFWALALVLSFSMLVALVLAILINVALILNGSSGRI